MGHIDQAILGIASAIMAGATASQIRENLLIKGWSEEDIFLLLHASSILVKYRFDK